MRLALLCAASLLVACAAEDADDAAMDTTTMAPALSAADIEGIWNFQTRPMDADTVIVTGQFTASNGAYHMVLAGREPQPTNVTVAGDSIMLVSGEYPSALRPGQMVSTTGVYRLVDGRMVGTVTARYPGVTTADSVVLLRVEMTRAQ